MKKDQSGNIADLLAAARSIANLAFEDGVGAMECVARPRTDHLGAVLADAVLQAGLNYSTVVRPRIDRIIQDYPEATEMTGLLEIVATGSASQFLDWTHPVKSSRFVRLVICLNELDVSKAHCLRTRLVDDTLRQRLGSINGIGPKTIDYMACLVGVDSIAVDRHVRSFAKRAGVMNNDYEYLKVAFCYAADLLSVPRREFDAWIWRSYARSSNRQLMFAF